DRAVIAPHHIGVDLCGLDRFAQGRGYQHVVDSPSDVAGARVGEVAPPAVVAVALLEEAQGIDEACIDVALKARPLLVGEALLAAVGFGIGQIELGVRPIEVAAEDHGLFLLELPHVAQERGIPVLVPQGEAAEVVLGIGRVDRHRIELGEFRRDEAAFLAGVALELIGEPEALRERLRKAVDDRERLFPGEDRRTGVALLDGRMPVLVIAGQIDLDLAALGLGLLQAQHIRPVLPHEALEKALLDDGTNAVDVPRVEFHRRGSLPEWCTSARAEIQSMSASNTPETTKVSWMSTIQRRRVASTAVAGLASKRKVRSSAMALIATM